MALGVAVGLATGVAFIVAFLRLPMYLWELPRCLQLSGRAIRRPEQAAALWRKQPLHYDEIIQLRLSGLDEHIAAIALADPEACLEAMADAGASLRQRWAVPQALGLILYEEMRRCATPALIARFDAATVWLPADAGIYAGGDHALLTELRSISADTAEAMGAATREARESKLRAQVERLRKQRLALARNDRARQRGYAEALEQWQRVLEKEAGAVAEQRAAAGELPMRYVAGGVLQAGSPAFQGRDDLFRTLEGLLISAPVKITPLLLGQPRTGKSSALRQLPRRLGAQVLPVYLNMEGRATASTATGLMSDLVREIRVAAQGHPHPLSLPPLDDALLAGDPYRVFLNWIKDIQPLLGADRWLLLALDEFDRIDEAVRERGIDSRIFAMTRELIEQYPRVALALSGNYNLAESDRRWREALKSVRTLPVTFLPPDDACRVFTRPAPDFPPDVYDAAAVARALELTGGQPYLLHLLGETVVNAYNRSRSDGAEGPPLRAPLPAEVIDAAVPHVLVAGDTCFASIWEWLLRIGYQPNGAPGAVSPKSAAAVALLHALASGQPLDQVGDAESRADLLGLFCERDVLEQVEGGAYRFQIPLLAQWIRQQRRLPGR
jgi:hypothetical protein